jgi:hypothetical protein
MYLIIDLEEDRIRKLYTQEWEVEKYIKESKDINIEVVKIPCEYVTMMFMKQFLPRA